MERIGTALSRNSTSPTTLLRQPCSEELAVQLGRLMAEAQAMKPNQVLPPGTPDMYLQAWEEIAQEWGLEGFKAGLWKALRSSPFFPSPDEIQGSCEALKAEKAAERRAEESRRVVEEHAQYLKDIKENPEKYFSVQDLVAEWMSRRTEAK